MEKNKKNRYGFDFTPMGFDIKTFREAQKITREKLAETLVITPRHLQAIKLEGKHPSLGLLAYIATIFDMHKRIDCQHTQARHTIHENRVVILFYFIDAGFQYAFTAYGVNQPYFQSRQFNVGREQVNALVMVQDASGNIDGFIVNDVLHDGGEHVRQVVWSTVTERHG